ncbi:hypothetical protein GSI_09798 [Ganoderma sinense ZZ0214-1]|uniref:Uncharacterized protein n=1 Tax=Ganoderma sinense ZZ0214-1 TaxID=1077348 RepID=A0A2G8S2P9_9APHY|nr:hypothetical protein GSI_09798 [Ganoderma sinense ZZ0214-1]
MSESAAPTSVVGTVTAIPSVLLVPLPTFVAPLHVFSKLEFVPFTPHYTNLKRKTPRSDRDVIREELRGEFDTTLVLKTGIDTMHMYYSEEQYARFIVWWLGLILDGWPWYIPFANLSNIKGGAAPLRLLQDLWRNGTLRFIPAPRDVRERALHDPHSVLPHVLAAAKLPALPLTIQGPKWSAARFQDFAAYPGSVAAASRPRTASTHAPSPAVAEERVLHPDDLEPILTRPLGPDTSPPARERRQRSDVNKARHRPVSNPDGKPSRSQTRMAGALTANFVLDRPGGPTAASTSGNTVLKPLSELRIPVLTSDDLGGYVPAGGSGDGGGEEDIESFSDSEDEADRRRGPKRRRCL